MEGFFIFALGAGSVLVAQRGRKHAKKAVGWVARQSGWLVSRVRTEIDTARRVAREEFERAREADHGPIVDVVVPSERVEPNGTARSEVKNA